MHRNKTQMQFETCNNKIGSNLQNISVFLMKMSEFLVWYYQLCRPHCSTNQIQSQQASQRILTNQGILLHIFKAWNQSRIYQQGQIQIANCIFIVYIISSIVLLFVIYLEQVELFCSSLLQYRLVKMFSIVTECNNIPQNFR